MRECHFDRTRKVSRFAASPIVKEQHLGLVTRHVMMNGDYIYA
jgi:hypothetical protein